MASFTPRNKGDAIALDFADPRRVLCIALPAANDPQYVDGALGVEYRRRGVTVGKVDELIAFRETFFMFSVYAESLSLGRYATPLAWHKDPVDKLFPVPAGKLVKRPLFGLF